MNLPIGFSLPIVGIGIFSIVVTLILCCYFWRLKREGQRELGYRKVVYKEMTSKNDTCAVCLEDFIAKDTIAICPCHHGYHQECLSTWLMNHSTCPMCKVQVRPDERTVLMTAAVVSQL